MHRKKIQPRMATDLTDDKPPRQHPTGDRSVTTRPRLRAEPARSRSDYLSTVRMPAGPPGTLIWPVTVKVLPSKLRTSSDLASMDWFSRVLPSLLQTTPWPQPPTLACAARVSLLPSTHAMIVVGLMGFGSVGAVLDRHGDVRAPA